MRTFCVFSIENETLSNLALSLIGRFEANNRAVIHFIMGAIIF